MRILGLRIFRGMGEELSELIHQAPGARSNNKFAKSRSNGSKEKPRDGAGQTLPHKRANGTSEAKAEEEEH